MDAAAQWQREHWQRIDELFYAALELDAAARPAFLGEACGGDLQLLREVESLLGSSQQTLGFARGAVAEVAARPSIALQPAGKRVGAYQLIRPLGEGGMGAVYLASRADESFHQLVAIKLMHPAVAPSQGMLLRFRAERQILANLNHPNIARLFDGGMTDDGIPYLAMEYVDGIRIDDYCRRNSLSVDARLKLFREVCSAVEYAHHNLVIHRDIKPANILVTAEGMPKLLDFGIAKLLDPDTGDANLTRTGDRLMTPEYASPEQVRGDRITTASDVYALGVLLYELLADKCPFELRTKSFLQVAEIVCEHMPDPPSRAVAAGTQHSAPDAMQKVKGDLDNIVMMAMRKEPSRRYTSVGALSHDVQAWLTGFSVHAHPDSWRYRTGKFATRHKVAVSIAAAAVLMLIGFSAAMAVLADRANQARRIANQQRLDAQREADFLASIFKVASSDGREITSRELLDQTASRIDKELADAPEVQAASLYNLGVAYSGFGLNGQALPLLERAYDIRRKLAGVSGLDMAKTEEALGHAYQEQGAYAEADGFIRQAIATAQSAPGSQTPFLARLQADLGFCLWLESRDADAIAAFRKSLALSSGPDNSDGAITRGLLAQVLERQGNYSAAWQLASEGSEILERLEGPSFHLAMLRHILANFLRDRGDQQGAERMERENLELWRKVAGNHVDVLYAQSNLGLILLAEGNDRDAEPLLQAALEARQKQLGERHPLVAVSLVNYGRALEAREDYTGAEANFTQAAEILRDTTGPASWNLENVLASFALLQMDRADYGGAEAYARQALAMTRTLGGDKNPEASGLLLDIGIAREFGGDAAGAEPFLGEALEIEKATLPSGYPALVTAETRLAESLVDQGKPELAEPLLRDAVASSRHPPFPVPAWQLAEAESALGVCLKKLKHPTEAAPLLQASGAALALEPESATRRWVLKFRAGT